MDPNGIPVEIGKLVSFREIEPSDADLTLSWRTNPRIAQWLVSEVKHNRDAQMKWLETCYDRTDYYHWIFQINGSDAGLANVSKLDARGKTTEWGFYTGEGKFLGFGALIPPIMYDWIFFTLGIRRVEALVAARNSSVRKIHSLHGYVEKSNSLSERTRESPASQTVKLELSREAWLARRRGDFTQIELPTSRWTQFVRIVSELSEATPTGKIV